MDSEAKITRKPLKKKIKYCPVCLSELNLVKGIYGWLVPEEYECPVCGYRGPIGLEKEQ
ncbi:MAG: hypothetical protein N2169_07825 [bacterium]|nr:hypothetical protein [bacterium]